MERSGVEREIKIVTALVIGGGSSLLGANIHNEVGNYPETHPTNPIVSSLGFKPSFELTLGDMVEAAGTSTPTPTPEMKKSTPTPSGEQTPSVKPEPSSTKSPVNCTVQVRVINGNPGKHLLVSPVEEKKILAVAPLDNKGNGRTPVFTVPCTDQENDTLTVMVSLSDYPNYSDKITIQDGMYDEVDAQKGGNLEPSWTPTSTASPTSTQTKTETPTATSTVIKTPAPLPVTDVVQGGKDINTGKSSGSSLPLFIVAGAFLGICTAIRSFRAGMAYGARGVIDGRILVPLPDEQRNILLRGVVGGIPPEQPIPGSAAGGPPVPPPPTP